MAINDNQKLDYLWKKLGYGVSKTDINSVKNATNESIPSPLLLRGDKLWAEASLIPAVIPTSDTTQVQLETSETTADATASANRTWKTNTTDWIPPEFGSTYQVKVYLDNSGAANPASTGTQLFAAGSGNNDEWFFDYQSGVLNFIGDNLPSGISGKTVYIVGARYIGNFGISGTTDGIVEGATNLYYTDERVDDRVANLFVDGKGLTKNYDDAGNLLNVEIDFTEFDTDDIVEGTVNTFLANRTTDDIAEGSNNLYYTDARTDARIALQTGANLDLSQKTTTELSEGTNLYYTDARADSRITAFGAVTQSDIDASIAALIDSAPTTLDTLNELAAALGDDPNFATSIANSIATKLATADFNATADTWLGTKSTTDLSEGANLYYTEARVDANFATKSTTDLTEGTNLYFTEERVDDRVATLIQDGVGITKNYDDAGNLLNIAIDFTEFDTDDIIEGTVNTFLSSRTTDDIPEGSTNLYYTDARFDTRLATKSTTDVAEGTNLYYTDARVATYLTNNGYTTTSAVAAQIASVSSDLDDEIYDREQADLNLQSQIDNLVLNDLTDVNASSPTSGDALVWNGTSWVPQAPFSQADFDSAFAAKTTTDLTEGTNLYYTDVRVRSHIQGQDLDLGSNKILFSNVYSALGDLPNASSYHGMFAHVHGTGKAYYAHAGSWIELANNSELPTSTDDISEGSTNLYFTEERVDDRVAALIQAGEDISVVYDDVANTLTIALASSVDGLDLSNNSTDDLSEGSTNLYYTDARVDANFATKTTTDLTEGTNLYYTDARVDANIATKTTDDITEGSTNLYYTDARVNTFLGSGNAGNIITTGYIAGPASFTIDPAAVGDNTGTVIIAGNLQVDGTTTTINSTTVEVDDLNIVLGAGSINAGAANGGGITIDLGTDGSATFTYNSTTDQFVSNKDITANITGQVSDISNHTTTDLAEGINLYYTQARFDTAFSAKTTTDLTEGTNLYYTDARVDANFATKTTTDLTEGTNLYYTQARFDTAFAAKDTDDLTEGSTNLYYTDARVNTWATANLANVAFSGSYADLSNTPTDLSDFTDTTGLLDIAAITVGDAAPSNPNDGDLWFDSSELKTFIYYNDGTSSQWVEAAGDGGASVQSSSTAPSSPSDGDLWFNDNNLKLYIYYNDGSSAQWVEASGGIAQDTDAIPEGNNNLYFTDARFDTRFATKDTDDLVEGSTNLYYTDARVDARIATSALGSTDDLPEGSTNLYYTDVRVQNVVSNSSIGNLNDVDMSTTPTNGQTIVWDGTNFIPGDSFSQSDFDTAFGLKDTDDLTEGSANLYYTDARVQTKLGNVSGSIIPDTNVTYDLGSSTNRFRDIYLSGSSIYLGTLQLSDNNGALEVTASGSTEAFATETYVDTAVANLVDSSPTTLDTLNELAAALGDDPNFSTTITNLIGTKLATVDFNTTADSWLTGKTTTDLTEGTNLYYTDARVDARITLQTGANLSLANKTTDDLAEGSTNLYYTNTRVKTYLEAYDGSIDIQGHNQGIYVTDPNTNATNYVIKNNGGQPFIHGQKYLPYASQTDLELEANTGGKINVNAFRIYNVGTPIGPSDAVNKSYVDSAIATKDHLSELSGTTDDVTEGTTNLYYTDARVDARITASNPYSSTDFDTDFSGKTTTDLTEGTNLYYTDARFDTRLATKTTDNLSEGLTNLYYTDARVRSHVEGQDLDLGTNKVLFSNVYNQFSDLPSATSYHGMFAHVHGTGKAYYAHAGNWIELGNNSDIPTSTDSLVEGSTNLYYTDARVGSYLTTNNYATQTYVDNAILTKDTIAEMGDVDLTTAPTDGQALVWDNANSKWVAGDSFSQSDFDSAFTAKNTDDVSEGSTNLYYTDARVASYLSGTGYATTSYVTSQIAAVSSDLDDEVYDREQADINLQSQIDSLTTNVGALVLNDLGDVGTTGVVTGDFLLYDGSEFLPVDFASEVNTYADTRISFASIQDLSDVDGVDTVASGDILLYDSSNNHFGFINLGSEINSYFDIRFATKSTTDLAEGTNLYYTDTRVETYLESNATADRIQLRTNNAYFGVGTAAGSAGMAIKNNSGQPFFYGQKYLPANNGQTDLELEANTGGKINVNAFRIYNVGTPTDPSDAANKSYVDSVIATKDQLSELSGTTDDVTEGTTNLYYTDARVGSYLTAQGISAETLTSLGITGNVLTYTDEDGNNTNIDLSLYLDDTNLARLVSGTLNGTTGIATFTRDDATTFTIDFSPLFDDTNLSRINSATFTNGTLTLTRDDASTAATVSLDGRYLQDLSGLTTDNLSEGLTNLYYTQARFDSAFTAKSTTDLSEGTNLYYTDARADARIALASVDDLSDVDTTTAAPTDGQALVWDNTNSKWVPGASASGSSIEVSDIAPSSPSDGDLWFDSSELKTFIYYNDGTSSQWVEAAGNVASNVYLSDAAPSAPSEGDLWFNSSNLRLYVYYNDGSSSQWIEASGSVNSAVQVSLDDLTDVDTTTTAPTNGQTLVFNGTNFVPGTISGYTTSDFNTDFAAKSTTDLAEGTNLYYTDSRVQTKLGDVSGHIIPDTDVTYDLGSSTHKFRDLYLSGNSITLGGIVLTEHSGALQVHTTGGGTAQPFATVSYVDTELANLVDSAPTTLDTLNELAAALGDDPNFATTITNLIGTKLATVDFNTTADSWLTTKSTTDLAEGTNLYYTDARFDTRFATKSTTDLAEGTNLYYTDARVRTHVEGQDLDLGTNKVLFSNMYATTGDLPNASSYHGMFAHVHGTGKAYYAHGGSWIELANASEVFDGTWASLTGTPTTIAGYGITDAFDGDYNSLTNKPSVPSALDDLTDVDLTTTSPTDGQALIWDSVNSVWKPGNVASGGGGGASVSVSDTAPSSPSVGDLWFNSANTKMYVYFNDGTSSQWIQSNPSGATSPIISSDTAPTNPVVNSLWFDSSDGSLYFRYDDGSSEQWVNLIGASLSGGGGGASVTVSDTAPTSPSAGDMWFDSQYATLLIYYNDGTNSQWVSVSGENNSTSTPQWQEQSADYTASVGDKLFVDCSSSAVTVTLPSSPSQGDEVRIIDATGNASINNITINRNGSNIQGAADNLIIETDRAAFGLVYYNATQGWLLMER